VCLCVTSCLHVICFSVRLNVCLFVCARWWVCVSTISARTPALQQSLRRPHHLCACAANEHQHTRSCRSVLRSHILKRSIHINAYTNTYTCIHVFVCVCVCACMCVYVCVCVCVCLCANILHRDSHAHLESNSCTARPTRVLRISTLHTFQTNLLITTYEVSASIFLR